MSAASIFAWIDHWARWTPQRTAVVTGDEQVSYADLTARIRAISALLRGRGVGVGDRVAVCAFNRVEILELLFACGRLGAVLVPINNRLTSSEARFQLEDCEPSAVLAEAAFEDMLRSAGTDPEDLDVFATLARAEGIGVSESGQEHGAPEHALLLVYTSGTTGTPKGAVLTQRSLHYTVLNGLAHEGFGTGSVVASVLPLFHVGGLNIQTVPCLFAGGTVVLAERFDSAGLVAIIRRHRPTHLLLVPAAMEALLDCDSLTPEDLGSLGALNCGSSIVPEGLIRRFNELGVRVVQVYGATETGPTAVVLDYREADRVGSCGRPATHCELRIVDATGSDLGPGQTGELWLKGPNLFTHYWNRPDETAQVFEEGWFRTGDLGRLDDDGLVYITGRVRELIISGGENIYPAEVERVLGEHPSVAQAAVVGEPDKRWGEVPMAFVVPRAGGTTDAAALEQWCEQRLAPYKRPREWIFVEDLPRTSLGKVKKHELSVHRAPDQQAD